MLHSSKVKKRYPFKMLNDQWKYKELLWIKFLNEHTNAATDCNVLKYCKNDEKGKKTHTIFNLNFFYRYSSWHNAMHIKTDSWG